MEKKKTTGIIDLSAFEKNSGSHRQNEQTRRPRIKKTVQPELNDWIRTEFVPSLCGKWDWFGLYFVLYHFAKSKDNRRVWPELVENRMWYDFQGEEYRRYVDENFEDAVYKVPQRVAGAKGMLSCAETIVNSRHELVCDAHLIWLEKAEEARKKDKNFSKKGHQEAFNALRRLLPSIKEYFDLP